MKKFKPVIASVIVVVLALGGMALWKWSGGESRAANNSPDKLPPSNASTDGYEFVTEPMEELPTLDPPSLWPGDARRMAAPEFWVIWTTSEFSKCRLWASHGERSWVEIGNTAGTEHYLLIDLSNFDSEVSFMVDFTERGKRYRSAKRRVSYGRGASFKQREYSFDADEPALREGLVIGIHGRDSFELRSTDFKFDMFPWDISFWASPRDGDANDEIRLGVFNPEIIPEDGCVGFMEVYDRQSATYDRTLVRLIR